MYFICQYSFAAKSNKPLWLLLLQVCNGNIENVTRAIVKVTGRIWYLSALFAVTSYRQCYVEPDFNLHFTVFFKKLKAKASDSYIARLTGTKPDQPRFTIIRSGSWSARVNGAAALMRPSIERANEQLDPRQQLANTPPLQSTTPGLHPVSIHQMAPPKRTSNCSLLFIYRFRKDERLSWPSWLTCSGRFTHIVVTRRLQADRRTGSVRRAKTGILPSVLRNQPNIKGIKHKVWWIDVMWSLVKVCILLRVNMSKSYSSCSVCCFHCCNTGELECVCAGLQRAWRECGIRWTRVRVWCGGWRQRGSGSKRFRSLIIYACHQL